MSEIYTEFEFYNVEKLVMECENFIEALITPIYYTKL